MIKIGLMQRVTYGFGNFGFGIVFQIIGSYLVFFGTAVLEIPAAWIGLAVSLGVVWDAVSDPLMGYISDHTRSKRFGRRHLYLLIGTAGICIFNILLWTIPVDLSVMTKAVLVFVYVMMMKTFLTIYSTPYTALGAELSSDYNERTQIQAMKTIFFLVGILLAVSFCLLVFFKATDAYPVGQLNPKGYSDMAYFASFGMLISGLVTYFKTRDHIPALNNQIVKSETHLIGSLVRILKNPNYRAVFFGYLFTNTASGIIGTIGLHVFTYSYALNSNQIAAIMGTQVVVSILSQGAWTAISARIDKKPSIILGVTTTIVGCIIILILTLFRDSIGSFFPYLMFFSVLVGFGMGGLFSIPLSMIADVTDQEALKTGERSEGISFGGLTLGYKLSQSIAIFALGIILQWINFDPNLAVQSQQTVVLLGLMLPIGGLLSFIAAYFAYNTYKLDRTQIQAIQQALSEKN